MPKISGRLPEHAIDDLKAGNKQFASMAVYWGTACNSLQAQVRVLLADRQKRNIVELIEVTNADMDSMRQCRVLGIPTMFSRYPNGVTKFYPIPEES